MVSKFNTIKSLVTVVNVKTRVLRVFFVVGMLFCNLSLQAQDVDFAIDFSVVSPAHPPFKGTSITELEQFLQQNPDVLRDLTKRGIIRVPVHTDDGLQEQRISEIKSKITAMFQRLGTPIKASKIQIIAFNAALERQKEFAVELMQRIYKESTIETNQFDTLIEKLEIEKETYRADSQQETKQFITDCIVSLKELEALPKDENGSPDINALSDLLERYGIVIGEKEVKANSKEASLLKQMKYPFDAYAKSFRVPFLDLSASEMLQGAGAKAFPFWCSIVAYLALYKDVPWAFWAASSLSLALDTFHGPMASSWMNMQDLMNKEMGSEYQSNFNFYYGVFWGLCFRTIAFYSGANPDMKDWYGTTSGFVNLVWLGVTFPGEKIGSKFGSRAYTALNRLAEFGVINTRKRDLIQQWIRDLMFMLSGILLGAGRENDPKFWMLYVFRQLFDESLHFTSQFFEHRPMIYIGSNEAMSSKHFKTLYPYAVSNEAPPTASLAKAVRESSYNVAIEPFISAAQGIYTPIANTAKLCKNILLGR